MKTLKDIPVISGARGVGGHSAEFRAIRGDFLVRGHRECGDIAIMKLFGLPLVSIAGPEILHQLLVEHARTIDKTIALKLAFHVLAGNGLFTSGGELWRRQRKLMAPLFQPAAVRDYATTMNEIIHRHLADWKDGQVIDANHEMTRIAMGVAGKVLFDVDTFDDSDELGAAIQTLFLHVTEQGGTLSLVARSIVAGRLLDMGQLSAWGERLRGGLIDQLGTPFWPTPKNRRLQAAVTTLDSRIARMIEDRRQNRNSRADLLARLLTARDEDDGSTMTDRQVRDEAVTLFVAGHETTATSATWALYFLARHPEVYARWRAEVDALGGVVPTAQDSVRLPYTLAIFKEALRLYPPAFLLDRVPLEQIALGDYTLERGTMILISPYALHRREQLWPEPERFDPDRFTPAAEAARHRFAWLPFGGGPRVCIGAQFAQLEAQLILSQIGQRFDLEPVEQAPVPPNFMTALRPARPVLLRLHARR